jgi:hypothetical protein
MMVNITANERPEKVRKAARPVNTTCQNFDKSASGKKNRAPAQPERDLKTKDKKIRIRRCYSPPQPPLEQEPELHPPPPSGLADDTENPERIPASIKSTVIEPQVLNNSVSTRNCREFLSNT